MPERPQASATVVLDLEQVRVTRWRLPPGSATGFHRHELDYVIVPVTGGELTLAEPGGVRIAALTAVAVVIGGIAAWASTAARQSTPPAPSQVIPAAQTAPPATPASSRPLATPASSPPPRAGCCPGCCRT